MAKKIRIVSKKEGFRRCGMAHSEVPTFHDPDVFDNGQLADLEAEPMLIVDEVDVPDKDIPDKDGAVKKESAKGGGKAAVGAK